MFFEIFILSPDNGNDRLKNMFRNKNVSSLGEDTLMSDLTAACRMKMKQRTSPYKFKLHFNLFKLSKM